MEELARLAPEVAIVGIFVWYLQSRDKLLSRAIEKLTTAINALEKRLEIVENKK